MFITFILSSAPKLTVHKYNPFPNPSYTNSFNIHSCSFFAHVLFLLEFWIQHFFLNCIPTDVYPFIAEL